MILAHVSGWSYSEMMGMEIREMFFWVNEAKKLLKKINGA